MSPAPHPLLRFSPIGGRVFILTRYRVEVPADDKPPVVIATRKVDVTGDFVYAMEEWRRYHRQVARRRRAVHPSPKRGTKT